MRQRAPLAPSTTKCAMDDPSLARERRPSRTAVYTQASLVIPAISQVPLAVVAVGAWQDRRHDRLAPARRREPARPVTRAFVEWR